MGPKWKKKGHHRASPSLNDLVGQLAQEQVYMALDVPTQTLHVTCAKTESNIKGIDAQEFPLIPEPDQENRTRVEADVFKQMINQVAFAAAVDDTRPTLTGVSTKFEGSQLSMAATDGFRLSLRTAHIPGYVEKATSVIIPSRALTEVARVTSDEVEAIYITFPEGCNQIIFDLDNVVVVSPVDRWQFPRLLAHRAQTPQYAHHFRHGRFPQSV
ncbi:MAG: DNA polymerase III subunit beta [Chloroflexi bacterium]|nr:DNA polymerase III subunit beta [Chloroflexota bacterium]